MALLSNEERFTDGGACQNRDCAAGLCWGDFTMVERIIYGVREAAE